MGHCVQQRALLGARDTNPLLRAAKWIMRERTAGLAIVQHTPIVVICSTTTNTLAFFSCSRLDHGGWGARRARTIWRTRFLPSRQHEARRLTK